MSLKNILTKLRCSFSHKHIKDMDIRMRLIYEDEDIKSYAVSAVCTSCQKVIVSRHFDITQ